jgi:DNA polymerase III delta prime subunit
VGLIGQDAALAALARPAAGSVLILGPDGVGRFQLALHAARAILGTDPAAAARVDTLQHVDLGVLDPAEGIDGVRAAAERLSRRPAEGPRQVLILRDLDRMSNEAHNALLKTLEEPPADAAVFAIAEAAHHLPETVVSRCRVIRARSLTEPETAQVLAGLGLPRELAADAEGSPGRAVYLHERGVPEAAGAVVGLLSRAGTDPLGEVEALVRRKTDEKAGDQRRRLSEVLKVAATRLRRELPATEQPLRCVVSALGSMAANANPAIVFSDLALHPWKKHPKR